MALAWCDPVTLYPLFGSVDRQTGGHGRVADQGIVLILVEPINKGSAAGGFRTGPPLNLWNTILGVVIDALVPTGDLSDRHAGRFKLAPDVIDREQDYLFDRQYIYVFVGLYIHGVNV